jgi:hypothetical protein
LVSRFQIKEVRTVKRFTPKRIERLRGVAKEESGASLVEFAFALMILLMLTFGMIDLGRAAYTANVVQVAAQMGARVGLIDMSQIFPTVEGKLIGLDRSKARITASLVDENGHIIGEVPTECEPDTPPPLDQRVQVVVDYDYKFITPFLGQIGSGILKLTGSASMLSQ